MSSITHTLQNELDLFETTDVLAWAHIAYQPHSIPPIEGAHAVAGGPKFQSRDIFALQRKLRFPNLKCEALEISEFRGPFETKLHCSFFGSL